MFVVVGYALLNIHDTVATMYSWELQSSPTQLLTTSSTRGAAQVVVKGTELKLVASPSRHDLSLSSFLDADFYKTDKPNTGGKEKKKYVYTYSPLQRVEGIIIYINIILSS